jgi:putative aldouronate transport system permease protein
LYIAALTSINTELYEAAKIDGAGPLRRIIYITVPGILPIIGFVLTLSISSILGTDFEQILMFYNAAVYDVADVIDTWVYRIGLGKMQYSIGSAVGLMKALASMVLIVTGNKISRRLSGRGIW